MTRFRMFFKFQISNFEGPSNCLLAQHAGI